ncbi:hypothetical protein CC80DRAFT_496074 [Byssothecium circinans]|uniref:Amino acid transporter transmembrane domain-containing protein n=1 Tax=Byssothecium circinans TaxID=147558 RepID=A0A6A5TFV1_9PLEO|nr:hypothetical protein CC80DRAFT_496074 [Byssothecium circinans]
MALGIGSEKAATSESPASDINDINSNDNSLVSDEYRDAEKGSVAGDNASRRSSFKRLEDPARRDLDPSEASTFDVDKQIALEADNDIKYRTCSWQKTAALLFSEYICLAIMSFPWSYSILGLVPGLILTAVVAALVLYTSLICWEFCMRHPEVRDVCDIAELIFFKNRWAFWFTATMFILNNTFIQGLHCVVGAKYLNTMTGHSMCTVGFSAIVAVISWFCSLPRTFDMLARGATLSAIFTFVSVILAAIFSAIEDHPANFPDKGPLNVLSIPTQGTTFIAGMNAFMNISYTFIGQITLPSFIAEMKEPRDFPKALWAVTIAEIVVFSLVGAIIYAYTGTNYITAPAFYSLSNQMYLKVSFSFMVPTIIFLGVLYASVSARFIFFRIYGKTKHMGTHTVKGWAVWGAILAVLWVLAFIVAEVIPFFTDLLSLMSSLFDAFFGFIYWAVAYFRMRSVDYGKDYFRTRGIRGWAGFLFNIVLIGIGLLFLTGGTYSTISDIAAGYKKSTFGGAFSCKDNTV